MFTRRDVLLAGIGSALVGLSGTAEADPGYQTIYYRSGRLRIEAYLYKPNGKGPFPLVVYNHGSRAGQERQEIPFRYIGAMLRQAGYATLVPERRGYGKSDGTAAGGADAAAGLADEASDVLAALDYLRTLSFVDMNRLAMMGWSYGGIVTMLALARTRAFKAGIDQAGGALSWKGNAGIRQAVLAAAASVDIPMYFMDARNDATTDAVVDTAAVLQKHGVSHELKIYPPFTPSSNPDNIAPGHLIFGMEGLHIWQADALSFLSANISSR